MRTSPSGVCHAVCVGTAQPCERMEVARAEDDHAPWTTAVGRQVCVRGRRDRPAERIPGMGHDDAPGGVAFRQPSLARALRGDQEGIDAGGQGR